MNLSQFNFKMIATISLLMMTQHNPNRSEKKPQRIGAILYTDKDTKKVFFLGYGEFVGCESPPDYVRGCVYLVRQSNGMNPKLRLDSGKIVWGCECWWGGESETRQELKEKKQKGYEVVEVDIDEVRKRQPAPLPVVTTLYGSNYAEKMAEIKQTATLILEDVQKVSEGMIEFYYLKTADEYIFTAKPKLQHLEEIKRSDNPPFFDMMRSDMVMRLFCSYPRDAKDTLKKLRILCNKPEVDNL